MLRRIVEGRSILKVLCVTTNLFFCVLAKFIRNELERINRIRTATYSIDSGETIRQNGNQYRDQERVGKSVYKRLSCIPAGSDAYPDTTYALQEDQDVKRFDKCLAVGKDQYTLH